MHDSTKALFTNLYRKLSLRLHPDKMPGRSDQAFQQLQSAKECAPKVPVLLPVAKQGCSARPGMNDRA